MPPADLLEHGRPVERELGVGEVHRFRVELAASDVLIAVVDQRGVDVVVSTFDPAGNKLGEIDGSNGPEPVLIEAKAAGAYRIEVRRFDATLVPGVQPAAPAAGRYEVRIDEIVPAAVYAERRAKDTIDSPRILELWRAIRERRPDAVAKFWGEVKGKTPLVEPYPGDPKDVLVTFVFRAPPNTPYIGMFGGPTISEKPLIRLADSDVWYLTARMPADARVGYAFIATTGPPEFHYPYRSWNRAVGPRYLKKSLDPNNPHAFFDLSLTELPGAPAQPWIAAKPGVPAGKLAELTLDSTHLKESRRVGVYTPPGYDPNQSYPLVVAFDAERYGLDMALIPLPQILDNLIAAKKIPPVVAALVASQSTGSLDPSVAFSKFIALELVPRLRTDYRAGMTPAQTTVTGSSYSGLLAAFAALQHSDVIGNVLSQSGAFGFRLGGVGTTELSPTVGGGWLIRQFVAAPKRPIRFYLDVGRFETDSSFDFLGMNHHMRDVLEAKGYAVTYAEFSGGHDPLGWRGTIADGLMTLVVD